MRRISFAHTTPQILAQTKTVTRRRGWDKLRVGDRLLAVKNLPRACGTDQKPLAVIEVVDVRREQLDELSLSCPGSRYNDEQKLAEVRREGFGKMPPDEFLRLFCQAFHCDRTDFVTRIEFRYVQ